jgi:regulator of protease activity HflC (stomatin/prohibitin superfamily)
MLRDIQLPEEYAKGLETLLLKKQENDRMGVETELKQKQVRIAELEAEATKVQQIKQAEGEAQVGAPEPHRPKLVSKSYRVEVLPHGRSGL